MQTMKKALEEATRNYDVTITLRKESCSVNFGKQKPRSERFVPKITTEGLYLEPAKEGEGYKVVETEVGGFRYYSMRFPSKHGMNSKKTKSVATEDASGRVKVVAVEDFEPKEKKKENNAVYSSSTISELKQAIASVNTLAKMSGAVLTVENGFLYAEVIRRTRI